MKVGASIMRGGLGRRLAELQERQKDAMFKALERGGARIADGYSKRVLNSPAGGQWYRSRWHARGQVNGAHKASAPGQAPAADSGELDMSATSHGYRPTMTVDAGSAAKHARYQELGTSTIEPRPALSPEFHEQLPSIVEDVVQSARKATL